MKAVMLMFDSLNRQMLPPYGCDWTHAPNFRRLAERAVTFDRSYVCSMPCMPARRDLHTGRPNFLHRSWGPLEPFDDSMPRLLRDAGVSSHLISDHYHYWETGGATYHCQYATWQFHRGQEGDPWMGQVAPPVFPPQVCERKGRPFVQDMINRQFVQEECELPQSKTFAAGLDFIRRNHDQDRWFLQIETFDPHEPFFSHRVYKDRYAEHYRGYQGKDFDWPAYRKVCETPEEVEHCRHEYASLLTMCDTKLGDVLDMFDTLSLWDDTMLILWTDHGFLLSEQEMWGKCSMPFYQEVAHTPFFIWDPRSGRRGQRRQALVQPAIDLAPTLLEFFGLPLPGDVLGKSLAQTIADDTPVRDAAIFGVHGGHVNVTDGRYVYMRAAATPDNAPLFDYTLVPTRMRDMFSVDELQDIGLAEPLSFTKGCRLMKIKRRARPVAFNFDTLLFDVQADPRQQRPLQDAALERRLIEAMTSLMQECEAPAEQFQRLGLEPALHAGARAGAAASARALRDLAG